MPQCPVCFRIIRTCTLYMYHLCSVKQIHMVQQLLFRSYTGCSLGIGDRRILRLLCRILWLNFTRSLKELLLLQFLMKTLATSFNTTCWFCWIRGCCFKTTMLNTKPRIGEHFLFFWVSTNDFGTKKKKISH